MPRLRRVQPLRTRRWNNPLPECRQGRGQLPPGAPFTYGSARPARPMMTHNPIRPWRNIDRRKSRADHGGQGAGGRRCADLGADHDQYATRRTCKATLAQIIRAADAGADIVRVSTPGRGIDPRAARDRARKPGADRGRHPFPLQTRDRGGRGGRRLPAHQPRQYRRRKARGRGGARRPRIMAVRSASG